MTVCWNSLYRSHVKYFELKMQLQVLLCRWQVKIIIYCSEGILLKAYKLYNKHVLMTYAVTHKIHHELWKKTNTHLGSTKFSVLL